MLKECFWTAFFSVWPEDLYLERLFGRRCLKTGFGGESSKLRIAELYFPTSTPLTSRGLTFAYVKEATAPRG